MAIARRGLFAILLWGLLTLAGCIVLPIPTSEDKVLAGAPVAESQLAFLTPVVTTQAEVVERLGQPTLVWEDARVFVYRWDMRQGILLWAVGAHVTGAAGKTDLPSHHQLLIRFDEAGRVERFEHQKRPSGVGVAQSIREWLGLPAPEPVAAEDRAVVLVRIELAVDGVAEPPFPRPKFTVDPLFAFGLGNLEMAERLSAAVRHRYLSEASRSGGWLVFDLAPGTWYFGMIGPDSNVTSSVSRFAQAGVTQQAEAIPRWRIDVPGDARAVYAGTLRVAGRTEGKLMFGNRIIRPVPGDEPVVVDESPLAAALLAAEAPQAGAPRSVLMQRWRPGEPLVFRSPLPASSNR